MSMNHSKMLIKTYFQHYLAQETTSTPKAIKTITVELMLATSVLEVVEQAHAKKKYREAGSFIPDSIKAVIIHKIFIR